MMTTEGGGEVNNTSYGTCQCVRYSNIRQQMNILSSKLKAGKMGKGQDFSSLRGNL